MCGISGIIRTDNKSVDPLEIQRMNSVIVHRGPDGDGFFFENNLALAHRRLAILGLGPEGIQPMKLEDKYVVTFNGEIYNYIEIGHELEQLGYSISYKTDTEVLLKAYDCWGIDCLSRFNGMWSFALYDRRRQKVFCSRDRFGVKPFYYTSWNSRFLFGSEIRQLLEISGEASLNEKVMLDYLFTGLEDHSEDCFFAGIKKLPPACYLLYDLTDQEFIIKKYYDLAAAVNSHEGSRDPLSSFSELFSDSINLRLRSDVRVGSCLSGGLDSSAIATAAATNYKPEGNESFTAIHARSVDAVTDESQYAQKVALKAGIDLKITEPSYKDLLRECYKIIEVQEEPFGSPSILMQYYVMQSAKAEGLIVLLDGQGGDETLLGYERYFAPYLMQFSGVNWIRNFLKLSANSKLSFKDLMLYFLYFSFSDIRKNRIKSRFSFVSKRYVDNYDFSILNKLVNRNLRKQQLSEISFYQLPHLLKYEDKNSMAWSIETRLPFLDYRMVENSLALAVNWKIRNGWSKFILRKSQQGLLPDEVVWRKNKFGFEAPAEWIKSNKEAFLKVIQKSAIIKELCAGNSIPDHDPIVLWRLFNIAAWEEVFKVSWK